ncbi:MAG TPA: class I SAM-dependent methyltransferase [Cyclobacteriaceae bacterium]|nr:class I SAM-dependent methyltransferase [Cyclobacteriaceae bacterium]
MSLEKVITCPVCQASEFNTHLICKDYTATGELFHVEQCQACGFLITTPRPTEENAGQYYQSEAYISHTAKAAGPIDYIYLTVRHFTLNWKYRLISRKGTPAKLLDFGSGTGSFLNYCIDKGIDAYGIEPSIKARDTHAKVRDSLAALEINDFNIITLWHVLEHVYTLEETLDKLKDLLAKTGTIFIAVPNWQSYDAQHYRAQWAAYDVPRHLWHFSQSTMKALLSKKGFKLQTIIPMKLDSYYVSLLSEKNTNGGTLPPMKMLRALRTAFISNAKAKKDLNYSSLIYVATK